VIIDSSFTNNVVDWSEVTSDAAALYERLDADKTGKGFLATYKAQVNAGAYSGGAIYAGPRATLEIDNTDFTANLADISGEWRTGRSSGAWPQGQAVARTSRTAPLS
jgi:hypothetical protein